MTLTGMLGAAVAIPVQSDTFETPAIMEFDSVGSMLREMDRESELNSMSRYASLPSVDLHSSHDECSTEDVNERVEALRSSLDESFDYTRMVRALDSESNAGISQLNALSELSNAALRDYIVERDNLEARGAAMERFAAMAVMMQAYGDEELAEMDDEVLAAKIEAAMRAAEAAINKEP